MMKSILVAAVVATVAYCCNSELGRAKIEDFHDRHLTWTEENILKNPQLYLSASEKELEKTLVDLKAGELSAAKGFAETSHLRDSALTAIRDAEESLSELVSLNAGNSAKWPVTWRGRRLDEEAYEWQVVHLSEDLENKREQVLQYEQTLEELKARPADAARSRSQIQAELAKLTAQRELLKARKINSDTAKRILDIRHTLKGVSSLMPGSDTQLPLGVDDLQTGAASKSKTARKEAYQKAMGF